MPDEPLGRGGEPRHADAIALGEADQTWPAIVADAARGELKEIYAPLKADGKEVKPPLGDYPVIPWDRMDLDQFNLIKHFPKMARRLLSLFGMTWQSFHLIPIESGRGCPYGCEFCTVTGFFGDSIRFRSNESVVNELLMLKKLEKREKGRSQSSLSMTTLPSIPGAPSHYCVKSLPAVPKSPGWPKSA